MISEIAAQAIGAIPVAVVVWLVGNRLIRRGAEVRKAQVADLRDLVSALRAWRCAK